MNINRNNYEPFFLSYLENRLQPGEVADLLVFLEQNPDLRIELEGLETITLKPDNQVLFTHRNRLKKIEFTDAVHINSWNYEEKMIALLEGDLSESESEEMKQFLRLNPHSAQELNLFRKTVLVPETVIYPDKNRLKKEGALLHFRTGYRMVASIAAVFTLLFGLYFLLYQHETSTTFHADTITETTLETEQGHAISVPDPALIDGERIIHHDRAKESRVAEIPVPSIARSLDPIPARPWNGNLNMDYTVLSIEKRDQFSDTDLFGVLSNADGSRPSFAGRFIRGVTSKVIGQQELSSKSLVEITIDGFNLIADREVEVDKKFDEEGNVIAYNIKGENISFFRNISRIQKSP
jgi:hypothetical protein